MVVSETRQVLFGQRHRKKGTTRLSQGHATVLLVVLTLANLTDMGNCDGDVAGVVLT